MDKQREEFEKFSVETMKFRIDDCNDPYVKGMNERDWKIWQAAQAAMQPETDRLNRNLIKNALQGLIDRNAELEAIIKASQEHCKWRQDEDGNWNTGCEELFVLNDGTPSENDMEFCCYCGKLLDDSFAP